MLAIFFMNFSRILDQISKQMVSQGWFPLGIRMEHPNVELLMVLYWMLPKIPTYTFINFQEIFPPIRLFSPICLLVFEEISHLYFYSDSSIRNSRVFINFCLFFSFFKVPIEHFCHCYCQCHWHQWQPTAHSVKWCHQIAFVRYPLEWTFHQNCGHG